MPTVIELLLGVIDLLLGVLALLLYWFILVCHQAREDRIVRRFMRALADPSGVDAARLRVDDLARAERHRRMHLKHKARVEIAVARVIDLDRRGANAISRRIADWRCQRVRRCAWFWTHSIPGSWSSWTRRWSRAIRRREFLIWGEAPYERVVDETLEQYRLRWLRHIGQGVEPPPFWSWPPDRAWFAEREERERLELEVVRRAPEEFAKARRKMSILLRHARTEKEERDKRLAARSKRD